LLTHCKPRPFEASGRPRFDGETLFAWGLSGASTSRLGGAAQRDPRSVALHGKRRSACGRELLLWAMRS
jgi:hypothetical protein